MFYKLVKFHNGLYGVRKGIFSHKYLDLYHPQFWWRKDSKWIGDCQGTLETATQAYAGLKRFATVVDAA